MKERLSTLGALLDGLPLIRNFGALSAGQILGRVIRFVYLIILARLLGPEDVGVFVYGIALCLVLSALAIFGQGIFLSTRIGRRRQDATRTVAHSFTVVLVMVVVATVIGLGLIGASESEPKALQAVGLLVLTLVPRSIVAWVRHCFVAFEDAGWIPRYEVVFRGGELLAGTLALLLWSDLRVVCAIHLSTWLVEATFALRRLVGKGGLSLVPGRDLRFLKRIFQVSLYFMLSLWFVNLFAQVGILGLGLLLEDTAIVGYFGTAMQILTTFLLLPLAFGQAILPSLSRGYHRGGPVPAVLTFVVRGLLVGGGILAILGQAYGAWIVTFVLGDRFAPAGSVFALLCWALGPYAVALLAIQALNGIGGRSLATILAVAIVSAQILLLLLCLPFGALAAASTALIAAAALGCLLGVLFIHKRLGLGGHSWWLNPSLAVAGTGAAMSLGVVPEAWAAPSAITLLVFLVWQLGVFSKADVRLIRGRVQAAAG